MKYILSLDQGTTSSRALLIDKEGKIAGKAQRPFRQIFPKPGWVEHDPLEIWSSQLSVATELLAQHGISIHDVGAVGITNQRETTILWDKKSGKPVYNAIVWQDRRTSAICERLKKDGLETMLKSKTGLLIDPYFSLTKILWIFENIPGVLERAKKGDIAFGTVDTWLTWKLTEGQCHMTDASNASRTLLYNIHTGMWDEEILSLLDIPKEIFPQVCDSSHLYAHTSTNIFSKSLPIASLIGDQQAALFGQLCLKAGMVKNTYGTGCFMLMNTGQTPVESNSRLLTTIAYQLHGVRTYALEGSVFIAGAVVQWLKENLGLIKTSEEVERLSRTVSDAAGVYFVPAFTGLGAPHWNPRARGMILGLTRGSTSAHIARAAIDSIAYQVTDLIRAMEDDSKIKIAELRVDGGASVNDLLMQFQADLLRVEVLRPKETELTAMGAALLAGLCVGFWKDIEEVSSHWMLSKKFSPSLDKELNSQRYSQWLKAVKVAQMWEDTAL